MQFDIITIFPKIFDSYFDESIIKRARKNKLVGINIHNLRDYTNDRHKTVDDTPYGGGAGMILKIEPIYKAVSFIISNFQFLTLPTGRQVSKQIPISKLKNFKNKKTRIIIFSAKGKKYAQKDAMRLSKYDSIIMICGRYEGVDERVAKHIADEEISIGDYVLTGGEIPAMVLVDSITRLIPGALGNIESLKEESFGKIQNSKFKIQNSALEYPQYTRPENFQGWKVPSILLSGDHRKINEWRAGKIKSKKNV